MKVVTQVCFPSSSCKGRLGRVFRLAQHGMDILRAHAQSIPKNRSLVLGVSALSTSALSSVLLFEVSASMHSQTTALIKNVSCLRTPGQTIQACADPSTPHAHKEGLLQDAQRESLLQDASGHSNVLKAGKSWKTLGKGELPEKPTS